MHGILENNLDSWGNLELNQIEEHFESESSESSEYYVDYSFEITANVVVNTQLEKLTEYGKKMPVEEILSSLKNLQQLYGKERLANWVQPVIQETCSIYL